MLISKLNKKSGGQVGINTNLSLWSLREAESKGLLNKDFISKIIKAGIRSSSGDIDFEGLLSDDFLLMDLAYLCYKTENKNGMEIEEFFEEVEINLEELSTIFICVITNLFKKNGEMPGEFKKVTPRQKSNGKKKKHRH